MTFSTARAGLLSSAAEAALARTGFCRCSHGLCLAAAAGVIGHGPTRAATACLRAAFLLTLAPFLSPTPFRYRPADLCTFCGKTTVTRVSTGIWNCSACRKTVAGGSYVLSTPAASTVRSNIARMRKIAEGGEGGAAI